MTAAIQAPTRGRPRTITHERIAEAGIQVGLPALTFIGVANALGVSHMALYKHVPNLEELKRIVVTEIFNHWQIPPLGDGEYDSLESYLLVFTASLRALVKAHPGLAPYLIQRAAATPSMMAKIDAHHCLVGRTFHLSKEKARWVLSLVAFHCIAVADTVYATVNNPDISASANRADSAEIEADFELGMRTLIAGALLRLDAHGTDSSRIGGEGDISDHLNRLGEQ